MLLDEIINAAVDNKVPIGTLLRKCLVLEQQVKNEKFRAWLDRPPAAKKTQGLIKRRKPV
jgi:AbiTii